MYFKSYNGLAWFLLLASLATLLTAFVSQYVFGLAPCILCIYQRWPYALIVAFSVLIFLVARHKVRNILLWLCVISLFAGAGVAAYHTGVEQGFFAGPDTCAEDELGNIDSIEELRREIMKVKVVRCDKPAIELWGVITMASANMVISLIMAIWVAFSVVMMRRKSGEQ